MAVVGYRVSRQLSQRGTLEELQIAHLCQQRIKHRGLVWACERTGPLLFRGVLGLNILTTKLLGSY